MPLPVSSAACPRARPNHHQIEYVHTEEDEDKRYFLDSQALIARHLTKNETPFAIPTATMVAAEDVGKLNHGTAIVISAYIFKKHAGDVNGDRLQNFIIEPNTITPVDNAPVSAADRRRNRSRAIQVTWSALCHPRFIVNRGLRLVPEFRHFRDEQALVDYFHHWRSSYRDNHPPKVVFLETGPATKKRIVTPDRDQRRTESPPSGPSGPVRDDTALNTITKSLAAMNSPSRARKQPSTGPAGPPESAKGKETVKKVDKTVAAAVDGETVAAAVDGETVAAAVADETVAAAVGDDDPTPSHDDGGSQSAADADPDI